MKYLLVVALLMSGCTSVRLNTTDYCHNQDGSLRTDDPRCGNLNPTQAVSPNGEINDNLNKR